MDARPGIVADTDDQLVVIGGDFEGTHARRWAWQKRALVIWAVTALPLGAVVAWQLHPVFAIFALSSMSVPLRPELSKGFRWGRPGSSSAWFRLRADARAVQLDHLFGLGCPPAQRALDPSPSADSLGVRLPGPFVAPWSELGPPTLDDDAICIGSHRFVLTDVEAVEQQRIVERLARLRDRAMSS